MVSSGISSLLSGYLFHPTFFKVQDLLDDLDSLMAKSEFLDQLVQDSRFIRIKGEYPEEDLFISERTLFLWFVRLNLRHARVCGDKLTVTYNQFLNLINSLRSESGWKKVPPDILSFGEQYGFITRTTNVAIFLLPLSNIMSSLSIKKSEYLFNNIEQMLISLADLTLEKRKDFIEISPEEWLRDAISALEIRNNRTIIMVMRKEGIISGEKETLDTVGKAHRVTGERVRQVIDIFWERFSRLPKSRKLMLQGIVLFILKSQGSLLVDEKTKIIHFLAKACKIPLNPVPLTNYSILGREIKILDQFDTITDKDDIGLDKNKLVSNISNKILLSQKDAIVLTNSIIDYRRQHLKKNDCVLIALRSIGKPAHYSNIYEELCALFPEQSSSERNIHAQLDRLAAKGDVVWIGVRGTYALREWGYERPPRKLFDSVAEIVRTEYKKTGRPVPKQKIYLEISKNRRIVSKVSVDMVLSFNKCIQETSANHYIPAMEEVDKYSEHEDEIINKGLTKFRQERSTAAKKII